MQVITKHSALKDLKNIDKSKQKVLFNLIKDINLTWNKKDLESKSVKLMGLNKDLYRIRYEDYRLIYSMEENENNDIKIIILRILHRKDAYRRINKL